MILVATRRIPSMTLRMVNRLEAVVLTILKAPRCPQASRTVKKEISATLPGQVKSWHIRKIETEVNRMIIHQQGILAQGLTQKTLDHLKDLMDVLSSKKVLRL